MRYRFVSLCLILIFLAGLGSTGHLTWKECLRLLVVQVGLAVFYFRLLRSPQERDPDATRRQFYAGAVLLALTTIFTMTQFDPATSSINLRVPQGRLNPFFIVTTVLAFASGALFIIFRWREFRLRHLTMLDRIALGSVFAVVAIALGGRPLLGNSVTRSDLLANAKILSYLFVWFPVTRLYADPQAWSDGETEIERRSLFRRRWFWPLTALTVLFMAAVVHGAYRTGMVIHHFQTGRKLLHEGASDAAQTHYELAQKLNETVDLGWVRDEGLHDLAVFRLKRGDNKGAEETIGALRSAIYDPAEANRKAGDVYADAEKWAQAAAAYEEFLKTSARNKRVLDRLGGAYLHLEDAQGFLRIVEKYQYIPKVEAQTYEQEIFLGNVQFYRKDFAAASRRFEAAAGLKPGDSYAVYKVGRAYLEQGKIASAIAQFQKAVTLEPGFADAYYRLGFCYEKQGRRDEALRMYEKTVELLPNHLDGLLALQRLGK